MIKLTRLKKIYNEGGTDEVVALKDISFTINDGEFVAITGRQGAEVTTLFRVLGCIDSYEDGAYSIDNKLVKSFEERRLAGLRNERIGLITREFPLLDGFSCIENVMFPLDFCESPELMVKEEDRRGRVMEALKFVGMDDMADAPVNKLFGVQRQRVVIARAIVNKQDIILADEPTKALNAKATDEIMELFRKLNDKGHTVIIATRDPEIAGRCQRVIKISGGKVWEG